MTSGNPKIFNFADFAAFLVAYVEHKQTRQRWFSVRRITKKAGLKSTAQLSLTMSGRRRPSCQLVERVSIALGLSEDEIRYAVLITERGLKSSTYLIEVIDRELSVIAARQTTADRREH